MNPVLTPALQNISDAAKMTLLWTMIVSFFMPIIVATVNQEHWRTQIKTVVGALCCVVAALIELILLGEYSPTNWALTALIVLAGSITFYGRFWGKKGLDVTDSIERATTIAEPKGDDSPNVGSD